MTQVLVRHQWLQWQRDKHMRWAMIAFLIFGIIALWHQEDYQESVSAVRTNAQEASRAEWLAQELKHPHMAAHFGNYAYKKPFVLHCFDPGLSIYTGTSVYMEPHRQNEFLFSKGQESDTGIRFGWLSPAMVCQVILPLFIILLSFNAINGEMKRGTLPLLLSQVSFRRILLAKTLAIFLLLESFLTVYLIVTILAALISVGGGFDFSAAFYVWVIYSMYCLCWSMIGIFISAKIENIGSSISALLLIWMFSTILMPRISANVAENVFGLATNYEFKKHVADDIEKGLDGHDSRSDRAQRVEKELLAQYKVDSVTKLPFNFEGYIMQQSEEYSSKVYDVHFNTIFQALQKQKAVQSWFSFLSPYIAVRNLSMAASNASLESEIDFQQQAEQYRRGFVQDMNNDMMNNSAYGTFDTYRVKSDKYSAIQDLQIENHGLSWSLPHVLIENGMLLLWTVGLSLALMTIGRKPVYN
ncbi:MAG: DUF3526 domain-containing protein [Chryseolinea sp.]